MRPKLLILVPSYEDGGEYSSLTNAIKETWGNDDRVFYAFCKPFPKVKEKNYIFIDLIEWNRRCLEKTLVWFNQIKDMDFDYIFRTNSGSFVDIEKAIDYLEDKPRFEFYDGIIGLAMDTCIKNITFCSGSGFFMSKDLVLQCLDLSYMTCLPDDVYFGKTMSDLGVKPHGTAFRGTVNDGIKCIQVNEGFQKPDEKKLYHYRLRNDAGKRNLDVELIKKLYKE